ncbi:DUF6766 family protein [Pedobacter sp. UC225_61]|uniref:DUF6766 family protein n=1 Tax=Pedobacter sp. UC225_61 TaxID=3374623 RepID=UPI00378C1920
MKKQKTSHSFFYRNSLTIVFTTLFLITLGAQAITGWHENNDEMRDLGANQLSFSTYLFSGHFISATFENFESEFLQMSLYVVLTIGLRQKGSAESKKIDEPEDVDLEPKVTKGAPWPVKKGGWILKLYSMSLSICFAILFLFSWAMHLYGSLKSHNAEQAAKHLPLDTIYSYLGQSEFWFETFQNWQSEFLSVAAIVFLTIYLRQKGSPESKPVDAPHMETGK